MWPFTSKPKEPKTINTADGVFVLKDDGTLGQRLGGLPAEAKTDEALVQIPDPNDPTKSIFVTRAEAHGKNAYQTPRERNSKMQTYFSPDGSTRQLDSNDPEDQKTIRELGLVTSSPSDENRKAKGFLDRMQAAEETMSRIEARGFKPGNIKDTMKDSVPLVGNFMTSDDYKAYQQAKEDWQRAKLRLESGAVIGKDESSEEFKTYFPSPGDTDAVKAQKMRSRLQAQSQLSTNAGLLGRIQSQAITDKIAEIEASLGGDGPKNAAVRMINGAKVTRISP